MSAAKALHKTFIDTSKIVVEKCVNFGEETSTPRPWSKYSKGSSAFRRHTKEKEDRQNRIKELQETSGKKSKNNAEKKKKKLTKTNDENQDVDELKDDPKLKEFLALHSTTGKDG